jgi:PAS domain S-box-containing protein
LHLEENPFEVDQIADTLRGEGIECTSTQVDSREAFEAALTRKDFDLILADYSLPGFDGVSALELARSRCPEVPFILLSGPGGEDTTLFQRGLTDYIPKEKLSRLVSSVRRAIHEIEQRQNLLQAEEERDSFFALSADLMCVLDFDGRFKRLNAPWEGTLGFSLEELLAERFVELVHEDDLPSTVAALEKLVEEKGSGEFVNRYRCRNDSWRWLHWKAIAEPSQRLIYATARDVTEQRLAQQDLLQSESRIRAIIEAALDCVISIDSEDRITEFNPAAERVFGYTRAEVLGRFLTELIIPLAAREQHRQAMSLDRATGESRRIGRRVEITAIRRDGSEFPAELAISRTGPAEQPSYTAFLRDITERKRAEEEIQRLAAFPRQSPQAVLEFDAAGALIYFNDAAQAIATALGEQHPSRILPPEVASTVRSCLATGRSQLNIETARAGRVLCWSFYPISASGVVHCYAQDISDRKRFDEQIREQAALLDKAHDAITVVDLEHRIVYWNQGAERLYGWAADEAVGKSALDLFWKRDEPELQSALGAVLEKEEWSGELKQQSRSGSAVIVQSRWTLVRGGAGQPRSILVISTDITEQKKLQTQFLRTQRLESIGTLASGIAHDLNNVLAPIMMSVNLLQESVVGENDAKLLETLRLSAERGADMVKQILSFTRGQEGSRCLVNIKHLVNDLAKILRETFPRMIQIETRSAKDQWAVMADATQMHQVLMNLAVNARDAMPQGGKLTIETENIVLDEHYARLHIDAKPGLYMALTVADTGSGIPADIIEKIFDPFFTMKAPGKGTGLGLSTTLSIVKNHGGFINTYSEVGKGTRFKIYLPAIETSHNSSEAEVKFEPPRGHGERILVVDDERAFQEISKAIFSQYGYRVLTASDGAEALAIFAQHKGEIDVVVTDMMMPFLDGQATIRALQHMDPGIRIIAASGLAENEVIAQRFNNAVFLPKPFTTERLLCTVDQVLRSRHVRN